MGHYDDIYEAEDAARQKAWDEESEKLIQEYGYGTLRQELEVLYNYLEFSQQNSCVFEQLGRLRKGLKLSSRDPYRHR